MNNQQNQDQNPHQNQQRFNVYEDDEENEDSKDGIVEMKQTNNYCGSSSNYVRVQ